jgi:hypothetical protein
MISGSAPGTGSCTVAGTEALIMGCTAGRGPIRWSPPVGAGAVVHGVPADHWRPALVLVMITGSGSTTGSCTAAGPATLIMGGPT